MVLYLVFIAWLKNPAVLRMIIITIGLSILVREAALHLWDEQVHALPFFSGDETTSVAFWAPASRRRCSGCSASRR